jgi:phenylacetate-CoA ligase
MNKLDFFQKAPHIVKNILASFYGLKINRTRFYKREYFKRQIESRGGFSYLDYQQWQKKQIEELLIYAWKKVPYYRNYWKNEGINDPQVIAKIDNWPVLLKDTIRENPMMFISDDYNPKSLLLMHTSGSSGKPMTYYFSKSAMGLWYYLYDKHIKTAHGLDIKKDSFGTFGGQLICDINQKKGPFWTRNMPGNQVYFSSYHLNEENVESYLDAIAKYKLTYLMGYTSSFVSLVKLADKRNLKIPQLKLVITNAEPLFDYQRSLISDAFKCPVQQTYSSCEYAFGGNEDINEIMFLWPEAGLLEVLTENNQVFNYGTGDFLATGLVNRAMPLIRFKTGDMGTKIRPLKDNFPYEIITKIEGRSDDMIFTSDGKSIGRLDPIFKSNFDIVEAQIIQHTLNQIEIKLVEGLNFNIQQKEEIIDRLRQRIGDKIEIIYSPVDHIVRGPNGKFKAVISKVKRN